MVILCHMNNTTKIDILLSLGKKVRERRNSLCISQEELASCCGFDRTYISLIERGKRNISFTNLASLASGLEVSISELVEDIS